MPRSSLGGKRSSQNQTDLDNSNAHGGSVVDNQDALEAVEEDNTLLQNTLGTLHTADAAVEDNRNTPEEVEADTPRTVALLGSREAADKD